MPSESRGGSQDLWHQTGRMALVQTPPPSPRLGSPMRQTGTGLPA